MLSQKKLLEISKKGKAILADNPNKKRVYISFGENLYEKIKRTGTDIVLRIKRNGRVKEIKLCSLENTSFDEIKKKIAEIKHKESIFEESPTIEEILKGFQEFYLQNRSNKRYQTMKSLIKNHLKPFYKYRANEISAVNVLNEIKKLNVSEYTKYSILTGLRLSLDYAVANYSCLTINPLNVLKNNSMIDVKKPASKGFKYVHPDLLKSVFLCKLDFIEPRYFLFLLFLAMTALRIGSALELRYSYIDKDGMRIIYPLDKMKARRTFELPITSRLKNLLVHIQQEFRFHNDVVFFSSVNPNHPMSMTSVQTIIKSLTNDQISAHSFRKIMRTYLTSIKVPVSISKMCLAHKVADQIDGIYDKYSFYDEKKKAFEAWHEFIYQNLSDNLKKFLD